MFQGTAEEGDFLVLMDTNEMPDTLVQGKTYQVLDVETIETQQFITILDSFGDVAVLNRDRFIRPGEHLH